MRAAAVFLLMLFAQAERRDIYLPGLEKRVFERVNKERAKAKLPPLKLDTLLSEIARAHSRDMAIHGFIGHVNPAGQTPMDRARAGGASCMFFSENIYQNNLYRPGVTTEWQIVYEWNTEDTIALTSVSGWMGSPGHRSNILNSRPKRTGIGVAVSSDQKVYITQEFC